LEDISKKIHDTARLIAWRIFWFDDRPGLDSLLAGVFICKKTHWKTYFSKKPI